MRQISKIHFTPKGELSNNFISLKKFEIRTVRPTQNKPTHLSGFLFLLVNYIFLKKYLKSCNKSLLTNSFFLISA